MHICVDTAALTSTFLSLYHTLSIYIYTLIHLQYRNIFFFFTFFIIKRIQEIFLLPHYFWEHTLYELFQAYISQKVRFYSTHEFHFALEIAFVVFQREVWLSFVDWRDGDTKQISTLPVDIFSFCKIQSKNSIEEMAFFFLFPCRAKKYFLM